MCSEANKQFSPPEAMRRSCRLFDPHTHNLVFGLAQLLPNFASVWNGSTRANQLEVDPDNQLLMNYSADNRKH